MLGQYLCSILRLASSALFVGFPAELCLSSSFPAVMKSPSERNQLWACGSEGQSSWCRGKAWQQNGRALMPCSTNLSASGDCSDALQLSCETADIYLSPLWRPEVQIKVQHGQHFRSSSLLVSFSFQLHSWALALGPSSSSYLAISSCISFFLFLMHMCVSLMCCGACVCLCVWFLRHCSPPCFRVSYWPRTHHLV